MSPRTLAVSLLLCASALLAGCGASGGPRPSIEPAPETPVAPAVTALARSSVTPSTTPVSTPPVSASSTVVSTTAPTATEGPPEHVDALALGGGTPVRSEPSMHDGQTVRTLADQEPVVILREVRGERLVVGDQTWPMAIQDWTNLWYRIDGGYVYAGFVFIPRPGELATIADRSGAHWIDVDVTAQTATAMIGDRAVHLAPATTGKPGFGTPPGDHFIAGWGRRLSETMTSSQAGIQDPAEQYNVQNVLYTQYFDADGDALHLNYWQPESVFGRQATSHGCVGLELHDAQYFWLFASAGARVSVHPVPSPTATAPATSVATPTSSVETERDSPAAGVATRAPAATPPPPRVLVPPRTPPARDYNHQ